MGTSTPPPTGAVDAEKLQNIDTKQTNITTTKSIQTGDAHTQELRHNFSVWSLSSLCLCLMATWEALSSVVAAALISGGAPCLFFNYVISFLGTIAVAVSLAEIASMYPTAGGQYHWVAMLAPKKSSITPSWMTAWISIGGQTVLTASAAFASGLQLQALVTLNNEGYIPERWQGMLFYWMILVYSALVNLWGSKLLPHTNLAAGVVHIVGFLVILIVLGVMAPKHTASYVFTETSNSSGWTNNGISWLVGLVSTVYPFLGYDSACHLSEEMNNPARDVPIAIVGSVVLNGILGFGYCLMLLFSLGDLGTLLESRTGFPFIQLLANVTKSPAAGSFLSLFASFIALAANSAGLTSTSRTAWSFARDSAIPFSAYFTKIDEKINVPKRMVVLITVLQMLLGLLYLGSSTAFNAVLSMAILGMYASYILPIGYMLAYGRKDGRHAAGPFRMGNLTGLILNVIACLWLAFAMLFSTFPNYQPVTPTNMNYSTVVMVGWMIFGMIYYLILGRKNYSGPVVEVLGMAAMHNSEA
ncbi:amino acid transporter-like protein [Bisporella sp. PMI_857]|nr:amino acid transporter-like protein [Bisporella sp. PMI_857]